MAESLNASIRPRPFSRGNVYKIYDRAVMAFALQFGHDLSAVETEIMEAILEQALFGFNSATTFQPWKPGADLTGARRFLGFNSATTFQPWKHGRTILSAKYREWLQFGHDLSAVETWPQHRYHRHPEPCFNSATTFQPWKHDHRGPECGWHEDASIRPRPFSRGNTAGCNLRGLALTVLQFGHDLSAVETVLII